MQMHDGKNIGLIRLDAVEETEREPLSQASINIVLKYGPGLRIREDIPKGGVDLQSKVLTESGLAALVVIDRRQELRLRLRMKLRSQREKRS